MLKSHFCTLFSLSGISFRSSTTARYAHVLPTSTQFQAYHQLTSEKHTVDSDETSTPPAHVREVVRRVV